MLADAIDGDIRQIDFQEALAATSLKRRHLLLGNGFSIAAHPRFGYSSLHAVAVKMTPTISSLFEDAQTSNFEVAMDASFDESDASDLRMALIKAITWVHPYNSLSLRDDECASCGAFLEPFVGLNRGERRGVVFTANYDLLLYWVLVRQSFILGCHDGFDPEGFWSATPSGTQAFYLHGGLHLFERRYSRAPPRVKKLLYERDRVLTHQIAERLDLGEFPIFVTEGTSIEKLARIRSSQYLRAAYKRFVGACEETASTLFVVGHGMGESDDHITDVIGSGQFEEVFVGTFGQSDQERAKVLSRLWARRRAMDGLPPIRVSMFDVADCQIWKREGPSGASGP